MQEHNGKNTQRQRKRKPTLIFKNCSYVCISLHRCYTQHSTEQFWYCFLSSSGSHCSHDVCWTGWDRYPWMIRHRYSVCLLASCHTLTTTTTVLRPFFRDNPGEPVPEENFWTLWYTGKLTEADTQRSLGATPSGLTSAHLHHPPLFYRPDALSAAQPTVSKHSLGRRC